MFDVKLSTKGLGRSFGTALEYCRAERLVKHAKRASPDVLESEGQFYCFQCALNKHRLSVLVERNESALPSDTYASFGQQTPRYWYCGGCDEYFER